MMVCKPLSLLKPPTAAARWLCLSKRFESAIRRRCGRVRLSSEPRARPFLAGGSAVCVVGAMGNYLEKPMEEKETRVHLGKIPFDPEVTVVQTAMQGWRKEMEDRSLLEFTMLNEKCCIFGVFDGHGGWEIAEHAADNFKKKFLEEVDKAPELPSDEVKLAEELGKCLKAAFISLDQAIAQHFFAPDGKLKPEWREKKQKDKDKEKPAPAAEAPADASEGAATSGAAETNPAEDGEGLVISGIHSIDLCGTTATVLLMTKKHYIVANAGDTRCVLATDGTVKRITEDHKPKLAREVKRIESAGGTVAHGRVQGLLAVSRCFGDQASARVARRARVRFSGARARARVSRVRVG